MKKRLQRIFASRIVAYHIYSLLHLYNSTLRVTVENEETWRAYHEEGGRVLLCSWHQQFFVPIRHFKSYAALRPGVMISRSRDGDIIANVAARSGWVPIRGSSSRGGREALRALAGHLEETRLAGHLVDGPRGPAGVVKPGLIRLAHLADARIFPCYVQVESAWHAPSWDRFILPKPFSRATLRFGDGIEVEPTEDPQAFEAQRCHVESIMRRDGAVGAAVGGAGQTPTVRGAGQTPTVRLAGSG